MTIAASIATQGEQFAVQGLKGMHPKITVINWWANNKVRRSQQGNWVLTDKGERTLTHLM
jgi:hypothetical protein